jgi:uncharacterized protein YggE
VKLLKSTRKLIVLVVSLILTSAVAACNVSSGASLPDLSLQNLERNTIRVSGVGEASGAPDIAFIQIGVEQRGDQVAEVVDEANQSLQSMTDALIEYGIPEEDIQTTRFNVDQREQRDPETGLPAEGVTYVVSAAQRVKVENVEQIGAVIQTGLDAGGNNVFGLQFGLADASTLQSEARLAAIDDAQARAGDLAEALGVEVGEPLYVTEVGGPEAPRVESAQALGAGAPPVQAGQLTVTVRVEVVFELVR